MTQYIYRETGNPVACTNCVTDAQGFVIRYISDWDFETRPKTYLGLPEECGMPPLPLGRCYFAYQCQLWRIDDRLPNAARDAVSARR